MLPYRVRNLSHGGRYKQSQQESQARNEDDPVARGGPIQRAIRLDMIEHRPEFLNRVAALSHCAQDLTGCHHVPAGQIFAAFKEIFASKKLALLHTRTIPLRVDRDSYSQLIYATCLSLLREAFLEGEESLLGDAAFALFCLFAMYETNPLPSGPTSERSKLNMLPLGLHSEDNAKFLFRRSFKTRIRIDRSHYILLLRLRDEALAKKSDCHALYVGGQRELLNKKLKGNESVSSNFCCTCGIARDVLHVIDRLFGAKAFDLAEYTGPCGLEALVGHEDYPYSTTKLATESKRRAQISCECSDENLDLDLVGLGHDVALSNELSTKMDTYLSSMRSIRPPETQNPIYFRRLPQREQKMRTTLKSLWRKNSSDKTWSACNGSNGSICRDGTPTPALAHAIEKTKLSEQQVELDEHGAPSSFEYEIELPSGLSERVQGGIKRTVQFLMAREGEVLKAKLADVSDEINVFPVSEIHGESALEVDSSVRKRLDDYSSVGNHTTSVLSIGTGAGERGLRELLNKARGPANVPKQSLNGTKVRKYPALTSDRNRFLTFLTMFPTHSDDDKLPEQPVSEVSDLSSDDEISVATSAVGQRALQTLLASVQPPAGSFAAASKTTKKRKRKSKKTATRSSNPASSRKQSSASRKRSEPPLSDDSDISLTSKSVLHEDGSLRSVRESGRAALDALLSQVAGPR